MKLQLEVNLSQKELVKLQNVAIAMRTDFNEVIDWLIKGVLFDNKIVPSLLSINLQKIM